MNNPIKNRTLRKYWFGKFPLSGLYLALGWIASLSTFFLSLMTGWFFELQFQNSLAKTQILEGSGLKMESLEVFFTLMGLVTLLKFTLQYLERKGLNQDVDRFIHYLVAKMYRRQLRWMPEKFEKKPFSKYLLRYSGDLLPVRNLLTHGIHRGLRDLLFLISGVLLLGWINPNLTLLVLLSGVLILPYFLWLDKRQLQLVPEKRSQKNELLHYVTQSFGTHSSLHEGNRINKSIREFNSRNDHLLSTQLNYQRLESLRHASINALGPILVGLLLFSSWMDWSSIGPGDLLAFLLVLGALIPAIRNVIKAPEIIEKGLLSLKKIDKLSKKANLNPRISAKPGDLSESKPILRRLKS
ncbi:ABC transporter ATP-binding protein [Algoriphagus sp. AK58]|uniref:ABC transporter ATP-binding protein n=1 Tax=Algoriphagus sp. AK58 TaxID=1406877 RepID=UPI0016507D4B|nr:ABC transporter ATP-binding protein [Algoriphagus sp. AK58]MBC6365206.1 hypothetical protein [Algoriphagus sp. AK58]